MVSEAPLARGCSALELGSTAGARDELGRWCLSRALTMAEDRDVKFSLGPATVRALLPAFPVLPGMAGHISFREATR